MVAPVGHGNAASAYRAERNFARTSEEGTETARRNSANSPAHRARAAIRDADLDRAAIRESGSGAPVPPANLHGKVTSALARGLDISGLLILQSEAPSEPELAEDGTTATSGTDETIAATPEVEDGVPAVTDGNEAAATTQTAIEEPAPSQVEETVPVGVGTADTETAPAAQTADESVNSLLVDLLLEGSGEDAG